MARKRTAKQWAGLPLLAGVIGLLALLRAYLFQSDWTSYALAGTSALLGLAFLWTFGRHGVWWAVVPGVGLLAAALVCLVYCLLWGNIAWLGLLILGLGAYVIAVLPNRKVWINAFYLLGVFLVLVAIYISPIVRMWQIILAVAFLLLLLLTLWLDREDLKRIWT